jgi:hypothetical protein
MRLAVKPYRYFAYSQGGAPWGSLSGSTGGRSGWDMDLGELDANWLCVQSTIVDALGNGEVADEDPGTSDPRIITRRYIGTLCEVVVAVRPATQGLRLPAYGKLARVHAPYTIQWPAEPGSEMALCDVETNRWSRRAMTGRGAGGGGTARVSTSSNWLLVVIPRKGVKIVGFEPLPDAHPGDEVVIVPRPIAGTGRSAPVEVWAPGLKVGPGGGPRAALPIGSKVTVRVPADALPGLYQVRIRGKNVLGIKRLLRVRPPKTKGA